ncbi:MAG TPA: energy transducer TonB, partial [Gemmatimonadaceae bacterium]
FDFQVERPVKSLSKNRPPAYPRELRQRGIEGEVLAKFVVDSTGRVDMTTFQIVKTHDSLFTKAVREAVQDYRFEPAQIGKRRVSQFVQMPFSFALTSSDTLFVGRTIH